MVKNASSFGGVTSDCIDAEETCYCPGHLVG